MTAPQIGRSLMKASNSKAVDAISAYEGLNKIYTSLRETWSRNFSYTVTVSEKDLLYPEVHTWLMQITPNEKHRALFVSSAPGSRMLESPEEEEISKALVVRFDANTVRTVVIDGYRVTVKVETPETEKATSLMSEPMPAKIKFTTKSYVAQQAVIKHLHRLNDKRATSRKAVLRMVNQWGSWRTRSDLPPRTLTSVSLPVDQKSRILNDLKEFLDSEERYNKLAISWHRGYMFHGPPGTGKTSLVKALANHFNLDLWYVSLSDLKAESSLLGLLAEVGPRSILLLEDIDTIKITQERDSSEQGTISMSALLNTLDGVATPHGLITIMTTNRFEVLDPALTRAGRMDLIEELTYPSISVLSSLFFHFYGEYPSWDNDWSDTPILGLSTAQVAEIFKQHMNDPRSAERETAKLFE